MRHDSQYVINNLVVCYPTSKMAAFTAQINTNTFRIYLLEAFKDNYIYLIEDLKRQRLTAIDPGDASVVIDFLSANYRGRKLDFVLSTHHHPDHTDGNLKLKKFYHCQIVGHSHDRHRIAGIDKGVDDNETFMLGSAQVQPMSLDGHTIGHMGYWFMNHNWFFCGDTLFSMGCGRLFEGTASQMFTTLQKIKKLPESTLIFCGHEYTDKNARFAGEVEPDNKDIQSRQAEVQRLRSCHQPTLPVSLLKEKQTNPFLRAESPSAFATLRQRRDCFK